MNIRATTLVLLFTLVTLAACGSGGGGITPPPTPPQSSAVKFYTYPSGAQWIVAPPGTATAQSAVNIVADSQQYFTTAMPDGSIRYKFAPTGLRTISVDYVMANGGRKNVRPDPFVVADNLTHDYALLGMAPNDFFFHGGKCYVVNSMDNNLAVYNASDFSFVGGMTFPIGASPSYIFVRDGLGVVTCNGNNRVYAFNPDDGSELWSVMIPADEVQFLGPGRPYADQDRIYVPLANIREFGQLGESTLYNPAQLATVNIASKNLETKVMLNGYNAVEAIPIGDNKIAVCEAGDISFDTGYVPFAYTTTYVEIYDLAEQAVSRSISIGVVGGGRLLYDEARKRLLIGSLLAGRVYQISTESWLVERGLLNPIDLSDSPTFISSMALAGDALLAASFNEDLIYSLDADSYTVGAWPLPEPLSLEQQALFLAGPQALHYDTAGNRLLILEGIANRVTKFSLPTMPD